MSGKLNSFNKKCINDNIKCEARGLKKYNGYCYQRLSNVEYLTSHLQCKETKQKIMDEFNCFDGIIILNKK